MAATTTTTTNSSNVVSGSFNLAFSNKKHSQTYSIQTNGKLDQTNQTFLLCLENK